MLRRDFVFAPCLAWKLEFLEAPSMLKTHASWIGNRLWGN